MQNIILNKKLVDDYVSVSDYLIGMGAMFFEQTGNMRKFISFQPGGSELWFLTGPQAQRGGAV